jgi:hypothetical protein
VAAQEGASGANVLKYTAQQPFHPERLHQLLSEHFSLIEEDEPSSDEGSQCR